MSPKDNSGDKDDKTIRRSRNRRDLSRRGSTLQSATARADDFLQDPQATQSVVNELRDTAHRRQPAAVPSSYKDHPTTSSHDQDKMKSRPNQSGQKIPTSTSNNRRSRSTQETGQGNPLNQSSINTESVKDQLRETAHRRQSGQNQQRSQNTTATREIQNLPTMDRAGTVQQSFFSGVPNDDTDIFDARTVVASGTASPPILQSSRNHPVSNRDAVQSGSGTGARETVSTTPARTQRGWGLAPSNVSRNIPRQGPRPATATVSAVAGSSGAGAGGGWGGLREAKPHEDATTESPLQSSSHDSQNRHTPLDEVALAQLMGQVGLGGPVDRAAPDASHPEEPGELMFQQGGPAELLSLMQSLGLRARLGHGGWEHMHHAHYDLLLQEARERLHVGATMLRAGGRYIPEDRLGARGFFRDTLYSGGELGNFFRFGGDRGHDAYVLINTTSPVYLAAREELILGDCEVYPNKIVRYTAYIQGGWILIYEYEGSSDDTPLSGGSERSLLAFGGGG